MLESELFVLSSPEETEQSVTSVYRAKVQAYWLQWETFSMRFMSQLQRIIISLVHADEACRQVADVWTIPTATDEPDRASHRICRSSATETIICSYRTSLAISTMENFGIYLTDIQPLLLFAPPCPPPTAPDAEHIDKNITESYIFDCSSMLKSFFKV